MSLTLVPTDDRYLDGIWQSRYFWLHLAFADLRSRYRRSILGLSWSLLQPLMLTALLAFVMGKIFGQSVASYAPFVLSGLVMWDYIVQSALLGCNSFVSAETYIKQFRHPLAIYSLRIAVYAFINMLIAFSGLMVWVLIWKPGHVGFSWLLMPIGLVILGFTGWGLATIFGFVGVRFRDLPQITQLLFQAVWYVSTVFISPDVFRRANVGWVVSLNPVNHYLNIVRAPLLEGNFPTLVNWIVALGTSVFVWGLAVLLVRRQERNVIFYL